VTISPRMPANPFEASAPARQALRQGRADQAVADSNMPRAGDTGRHVEARRMYADGDGEPHEQGRAYDYFKRLHPGLWRGSAGLLAPFVSKAFVNLGRYYSEGIPGTVPADPVRGGRGGVSDMLPPISAMPRRNIT